VNIAAFDLNLLVAFDALLEERSVSRAASRLGLSQPAMSNALARLRDHVGDPLFERTRHGIAPTPRALAMAEPIRSAMASVQRALSGSAEAAPQPRTLIITANSYAESLLLPAVAREIEGAQQPFTLDVRRGQTNARNDDGLTVAWRGAAPTETDAQSIVALRDSLVCIVRRGNSAIGDRFPLSTFLACMHVAVDSEPSPARDIVDSALATLGKGRRVAVRVSDFVGAAWIVSQTDLVAVVPLRLAQSMASRLGLGILKAPLELPDLVLEVFWTRRAGDDRLAMWLKERILEAGRLLARGAHE